MIKQLMKGVPLMKKTLIFLSVFILLLMGCAKNPQAQMNPTEKEIPIKTVSSPPVQKNQMPKNRIVGYFTSWSAYARNSSVQEIDPSCLTHLNFAFANLQPDGEITIGDSWADLEKSYHEEPGGHFAQLQKLKEINPELKILISVGGWTWSGNFSAVASTEAGRKKFAQSAVHFLTTYGFDGIDIDWEFPVEGGNGIAHLPEDKENYTLLLKETRAALDIQGQKDTKQYLLTIAGGPNPSFVQNTELSSMGNYVDFINIMAYDYHGAWENTTGHNTPLYSSSSELSVSTTVDAYLQSGIDASKLNLGLAFYGRGWNQVSSSQNNGLHQSGSLPSGTGSGLGTWEAGVFDYWDLNKNYVNQNGYTRYFDELAKVPYLYNGSVFISYDDIESISAKVDYAKEKGLGGVMFWEFYGDKEKELQKHLYLSLFSSMPASSSEPISSKPTFIPAPSTVEETEKLPEWDKNQVYTAGDKVVYQQKQYEAKWWTQNETPTSEQEWGPWKPIP